MKIFLGLVFFSLMILNLSVSYAGKVKSSKSYYSKIERSMLEVTKNIDDIKTILNGHHKIGSFITTDFWGNQPSWYASVNGSGVTNKYPFADDWISPRSIFKDNRSTLVRNINGVVFVPSYIKDRWREGVYLDMNLPMGYLYDDGDYNRREISKKIKRKLMSMGVPSNNVDTAFDVFQKKLEPVKELLSKVLFVKLDTLNGDNTFSGDLQAYKYIAYKEKLEANPDYFVPRAHGEIFNESMFKKYNKNLIVESQKNRAGEYDEYARDSSLWTYYHVAYRYDIAVYRQHFQVAGYSDDGQRYNQLKKLKELLSNYVEQGKAKVIKKSDSLYLYEDVKGNGRGKGGLTIDFNTGEGYWQLPIWNEKSNFSNLSKKLTKSYGDVSKLIKNHLSICLTETVKEFNASEMRNNDSF